MNVRTGWIAGVAVLAVIVCFVRGSGRAAPAEAPGREAAVSQLLSLHRDVIDAHLRGDPAGITGRESEDYVLAGRGEITFPSLESRRERFAGYLGATTFTEYRDMVEPVVQVSPDGNLGWVIAQVEARGKQVSQDGTEELISFQWAWIELYERRDGRWFRVGNLSNFKPE
jgi:hypothetical protein